MSGNQAARQEYVLGHSADELQRLDRQAAAIERATGLLLRASGVAPGMRVLDLGTGLGHVARLVGDLVGPSGQVLGVDASAAALAIARERTDASGLRHVTFEEADVSAWRASEPFDAIVTRLLLFHVADPVALVRRQLANLRHGGIFVAIDFDIGASRSEPAIPMVDDALRWVLRAFHAAGARPRIGATLGPILTSAGLANVATFGVQGYVPPHDPVGPALLAGVLRTLAPVIVQHGIATSEALGIDTLEQRIAAAVRDAGAVILPPTVVGAWGTAATSSRPVVEPSV